MILHYFWRILAWKITETLNHIFVFIDPDGALFPWYCFPIDGWSLWGYWNRDKNFQAKRIYVQFTQPTNEVEGSITIWSPFSNLQMSNSANSASYRSLCFRYLRMNHCKLTSGCLYYGLRKNFLKSIMNLLSLVFQNVSHLLHTKQFQVMFHSLFNHVFRNIQVLSYWLNFYYSSICSLRNASLPSNDQPKRWCIHTSTAIRPDTWMHTYLTLKCKIQVCQMPNFSPCKNTRYKPWIQQILLIE